MAEFGCCKRAGQRIYYVVMAIVYGVTLLIELVTLGTFGSQFSRTRGFYSSQVCVLFLDDSALSPTSPPSNSASCGFTLWGLVTVVIVLVVWTIFHVIMAIIGRPKITSLIRIVDLIMVSLMAFLSLIISSVLTGGLASTCSNTRDGSLPGCRHKHFRRTNDDEQLSFFGPLDAAKDTSWTVTIVFILLIGWYVMSLVMHCCISKYRKDEEQEQAAADKKKKNSELPDFSSDGDAEEEKEKDIVDSEDSAAQLKL